MTQLSDIIIIGAGLIGLSVADSLLRRGARVRIYEAKGGPGEGAGQYNSAMIHPSQSLPWQIASCGIDFTQEDRVDAGRQVYALATSSAYLVGENYARLGLKDGYHQSGTLQLFDNEAEITRAAKDYARLGVAFEQRQDKSLGKSRPALMFPGDSYGDPWAYSRALAADLIRRGGKIMYNQRAELAMPRGVAALTVGGKVVRADAIVLCAGAASAEIARGAGLALPIIPVTGHAVDINWPKGFAMPDRPIMHAPTRSALTPFGDFARLSGTVGLAAPEALLTIWDKLMPGLASAAGEPRLKWSAARPVSRLGRPLLTPTPAAGLWLACGHGHMGWTLCAGSGEIMADQVLGMADYPEFGLK